MLLQEHSKIRVVQMMISTVNPSHLPVVSAFGKQTLAETINNNNNSKKKNFLFYSYSLLPFQS